MAFGRECLRHGRNRTVWRYFQEGLEPPGAHLATSACTAARKGGDGVMIYIYCGPTLSPAPPPPFPHAVYLPPVAQGDIYRLVARRPWAIAIIDGYFERRPAVTHKEILLAMSEGIHVYGAASMGALRAAELETFGMVGIGGIFKDYRAGMLEDDDEVAVAHASEQDGFRAASEAMVNLRATFDHAAAEGILTAAESALLQRIGKSLFYPQRHYATILETALAEGMAGDIAEKLRVWLPTGRVDRKREDALALLRLLNEKFAVRPEPKRVSYSLNRTEMWDFSMRRAANHEPGLAPEAETDQLFDELRLLGPQRYRECRDGALLRALANEQAARDGLTPLAGEARLELVRKQMQDESAAQLSCELRFRGLYEELAASACAKRALLEQLGGADTDSAGVTREQLLAWHFDVQGRNAPEDLSAYAADLDLPGPDVLIQLLLREYLFKKQQENQIHVT